MIGQLTGRALAVFIFTTTNIGLSAYFFPLTNKSISISRGSEIFRERCASCHAVAAVGNGIGPNLMKIGLESHSRVAGESSVRYLSNSILYPEKFKASSGVMPAGLASDLKRYEYLSLLAYLQTLGGKTDYATLINLSYNVPEVSKIQTRTISVESIERGRELFFGKFQCGNCHGFESISGKSVVAPSLRGVGHLPPSEIAKSIREPNAVVDPSYVEYRVLTIDGNPHTGRLLREDDKKVVLLSSDQAGGWGPIEIPKEEIEQMVTTGRSSMPIWTENAMPESELRHLIDFLGAIR